MKNLTLAVLLVLFLVSCGKEETMPIEIKEKEKNILEVRAASEYPLALTSTDNYIGVEYYKDYNEKDIITVSVNNLKASLISEVTEKYQLSNDNFTSRTLFKLPGIAETGDVKINVSIKNNQKTVNVEGTLRFVNDYSLNAVWKNLDRTYISTRYFYINRLKNADIALQQIAFTSANEFFLGFYVKNFGNFNTYEDRLFIPGLPGRYAVVYNGNNIQQIKTINGDKIADQNFDITKFYTDLTSIYGAGVVQPQTNNNKVTIFKSGVFQLTVTETSREVSTIITLL